MNKIAKKYLININFSISSIMFSQHFYLNCSISETSEIDQLFEDKSIILLKIVENNNKIMENNKKNVLVDYILGKKIKIIDIIDDKMSSLLNMKKDSFEYILIQNQIIELQNKLLSTVLNTNCKQNLDFIMANNGLLYKLLNTILQNNNLETDNTSSILRQNFEYKLKIQKLEDMIFKKDEENAGILENLEEQKQNLKITQEIHEKTIKNITQNQLQTSPILGNNLNNNKTVRKESIVDKISNIFHNKNSKEEEIQNLFKVSNEQLKEEAEQIKSKNIHHKSSFCSIHSDNNGESPVNTKKHNKSFFMPNNTAQFNQFLSPQHNKSRTINKENLNDWKKDFQMHGFPLLYGKTEKKPEEDNDKEKKLIIKMQHCFVEDKLVKSCDNTPKSVTGNKYKGVKDKLQNFLKEEKSNEIHYLDKHNDTEIFLQQQENKIIKKTDQFSNINKNLQETQQEQISSFQAEFMDKKQEKKEEKDENVFFNRMNSNASNNSSLWENPNYSHMLFEHQQSLKNTKQDNSIVTKEVNNELFESNDHINYDKQPKETFTQLTEQFEQKYEDKFKEKSNTSKSQNSQIVFDTTLVKKMTNQSPSNVDNLQNTNFVEHFVTLDTTSNNKFLINQLNSATIKSKPSSFLNNSLSDWSDNPLISSQESPGTGKKSKFNNQINTSKIVQNIQQEKQQALFDLASGNKLNKTEEFNNKRTDKKKLSQFRIPAEANEKLLTHINKNGKNYTFKTFKKK